jgi:hypothetical protein
MSSLSSTTDLEKKEESGKDDGMIQKLVRGKENKVDKEVEGLLIFAKRDGEFIGREDILKEFRLKKLEWERKET